MEATDKPGTQDLSIKDQWFFVGIPIFHSRVFCFVGSRKKMMESAYAGIANFGLEDGADCSRYVEEYFFKKGTDTQPIGEFFCREGTSYIRIDRMYVGALEDMLVLNHECLHVANAILTWIRLNEEANIEGLCYTHEFIFGEIMKQMMASKGVTPTSRPPFS